MGFGASAFYGNWLSKLAASGRNIDIYWGIYKASQSLQVCRGGLRVGEKVQERNEDSLQVPYKCPDHLPKGMLARHFLMLHDHVLAREG